MQRIHRHRYPLLTYIATVSLLSACGGDDDTPDGGGQLDAVVVADSGVLEGDRDGDEWQDDFDNCPDAFNPEQRDRDQDGVGDACDTCPATPNNGDRMPGQEACETATETEPNNDPGVGEPFSVANIGRISVVQGTVEPPSENNQSYDRFAVMMPEKTLLSVRVSRASAKSLLEPAIIVTGGGYTTSRIAHGLFTAERQIYIAEAGTYEIAVTDRRGALADDPRGNNDYSYALAVEALTVEPESLTAPFTARPFIMEPGRIGIYESTLDAAELTRVTTETDLGKTISASGMDTVLMVELEDGTVFENDDIADGYLDSRLIFELTNQQTFRVILDHHRIYGDEEIEVRLTVDQIDESLELEPNDIFELATELIFPGETTGQINEPLSRDQGPPDLDWYYLDANAGRILALSTLIPPGSQVDPLMALGVVENDEFITLYLNDDSSGNAPRIEAILPWTRRYYIGVIDEMNNEPPFRGGDLFNYGIFSEPMGIQPEPVVITSTGTFSGNLNPGGRLVRHLIVGSEPTLLTFELIAKAPPDIQPYIRVFGPSAHDQIGVGLERALAYLPAAESYIATVQNAANGSGAPNFTYDIAVHYRRMVAMAEAEPNDTTPQAQLITPLPNVLLANNSAETDVDRYEVTLTGGNTLDAVVSQGSITRLVDLLDTAENPLASGQGGIQGYPVPASGTFIIQVTSTVPGDYTLIVDEY